jgi:hypothetical protein
MAEARKRRRKERAEAQAPVTNEHESTQRSAPAADVVQAPVDEAGENFLVTGPPEAPASFAIVTPRQQRTVGRFEERVFVNGLTARVRIETLPVVHARLNGRDVYLVPSTGAIVTEPALDPVVPVLPATLSPEAERTIALIERDRRALFEGRPLPQDRGTFDTGAGRASRSPYAGQRAKSGWLRDSLFGGEV